MAHQLILAVEIYGLAGGCVALWFVAWGIDRVDPAAHGAFAFRILLIPGLVLLWPMIIMRYRQLRRAG